MVKYRVRTNRNEVIRVSDLKEIFEKYTSLSRTALLTTASRSMAASLSHLGRMKAGSENELLSAIVATALGADGEPSDEEMGFMEELFSESREKLSALTARFENKKMRLAIDRLVDSLPEEGKRAVLTLCLCILASDKSLSPEENAFLLRLTR